MWRITVAKGTLCWPGLSSDIEQIKGKFKNICDVIKQNVSELAGIDF